MCLRKIRFLKVMLVLVLVLQLSNQRLSLSNSKPNIQGRHRRSKNDIIIGKPLSEEEFQLSLHIDTQSTDENGSPTNQGLNLSGLYEGDIAGLRPTASGGNEAHNAVNSEERLWKDGIVPYEIADSFTGDERKIIARGIRNIQDKSCIQFVKKTTEKDYVQIVSSAVGCFSEIGRTGTGRQTINLQRPICMSVETVTHELMHALGFAHEHNRPDRDKYIKINVDNLENGTISQFDIYNPDKFNYLADYDINSIMHYKSYAFAKNKNIRTIRPQRPLKDNTFIGPIDGLLSPIDKIKLNKLYNCDLSLSISCPNEYLGEKSDDNRCFKLPNFGCYCIVRKLQKRAEADQFCRDHKMQLVWLESKKESDEVSKLMVENGMERYWTSGIDRDLDKQWRWEQLQSSASFPITEFDWCAKSPDNFDGKEFYLLVRNHPGGKICWEDAPGDFPSPAICKPSLSAKMLLDNLKLYTKAISKLHSELTASYSEMKELKKTFLENLIERREDETGLTKTDVPESIPNPE